MNLKEHWQRIETINNMCGPARYVSTYHNQQIIDSAIVTRPLDYPVRCDDDTVLAATGFVYIPAELDEMIPVELPMVPAELPKERLSLDK